MAEEKKEVVLTYETLYEIRRNEKKNDLTKLRPTFLNDVKEYLDEKRQMLSSSGKQSDEENQRVANQLINIKRIIKEIYQTRERKVLDIALNKTRAPPEAIIDTSALLPHEKELFDTLVKALSKSRRTNLIKVLDGKYIPIVNKVESEKEEKRRQDKEKYEEKQPEEEKKPETKLVRFLSSVPKFMGKDMEVYGPFDEEDVASLPVEVVELLLKKEKVEMLDE